MSTGGTNPEPVTPIDLGDLSRLSPRPDAAIANDTLSSSSGFATCNKMNKAITVGCHYNMVQYNIIMHTALSVRGRTYIRV